MTLLRMKKLRVRKWLIRVVAIALLLLVSWITFYSYRSHGGSYHEIIYEGGIVSAVWFPTDFEPRQVAPTRPLGITGRGRYAPQTRLPKHYPLDWPLLIIDRWLFHKSVRTISGQGDMPRLYELSSDGKRLIPATN